MSDIGLPIGGRSPDAGHAVQALIDAVHEYEGSLQLVTLGPLTNIAMALSIAPEIAHKIKRCVIIGGTSDYYGNATPVAEFNVLADPEAAEIVFASDLQKVMVGWDISRKYAAFDDDQAADIRAVGTRKAEIAVDSQKSVREFGKATGMVGFDLPDPIAMAVALSEDTVVDSKMAAVAVVLGDGLACGMTIIDDRGYLGRKESTRVILKADSAHFRKLLKESLQ